MTKEIDDLQKALERATEGMTVLEKALYVCRIFNKIAEEDGGQPWLIEAKTDGGFIIRIREKTNGR